RGHGPDGAVRHGVLRRGVLRQVHPVPDRLGARGGDDRPDHRRPGPGAEPPAPGGPVQHHDQGLAVRHGWPDPHAGAQRAAALPRGLRQEPGMSVFERERTAGDPATDHPYAPEVDYGTPPVPGEPTARVTIDGVEVMVPPGTSVLRAAKEAGIDIPKLCATDTLRAFGSCRLCLVEVDGAKGTPASCTTPCTDGMVVRTDTEEVRRLRHGVMELYLSDHPTDCDGCGRGNCEMQALARRTGVAEVRYGLDGANHLG